MMLQCPVIQCSILNHYSTISKCVWVCTCSSWPSNPLVLHCFGILHCLAPWREALALPLRRSRRTWGRTPMNGSINETDDVDDQRWDFGVEFQTDPCGFNSTQILLDHQTHGTFFWHTRRPPQRQGTQSTAITCCWQALLKSSSARTYHELLMHNSYCRVAWRWAIRSQKCGENVVLKAEERKWGSIARMAVRQYGINMGIYGGFLK